eukprot:15908-Amphidinium_carterae.1
MLIEFLQAAMKSDVMLAIVCVWFTFALAAIKALDVLCLRMPTLTLTANVDRCVKLSSRDRQASSNVIQITAHGTSSADIFG